MPGNERTAGQAAVLGPAAGGNGDGGLSLSVFADLGATLSRLATVIDRDYQQRIALRNAIYPIEIPPQTVAVTAGGTVTIASPELLGPRSGWFWDVRRVTVAGLASSTEVVTIYRGETGSSTDQVNTQAIASLTGKTGTYAPGLGALLLRPGQSVVVAGASLTASELVSVSGDAICVKAEYLGAYLL